MITVLKQLAEVAETMQKFLVFLGPSFIAITGNSEKIDQLVDEVKALLIPFQTSSINYFVKTY